MFYNIYLYRFFILNSVKTEFKTKFARSKLGLLWAIVGPLTQVLVYALVLSAVLSSKLPGIENKFSYSIYLMSGMLCWSLFSEILVRSVNVFTDSANIIKKISFPKIILPCVIALSSFLNNLMLLISIVIVFVFMGHPIGFYILFLPLLILLTISLSLGLGIIFGVLNVFSRDIFQIINITLQFIFWLTPIVYMVDIVSIKFHLIFELNPLVALVEGYHDILLYGKMPDLKSLLYPAIFSLVSLLISFFIYDRSKEDMADVL